MICEGIRGNINICGCRIDRLPHGQNGFGKLHVITFTIKRKLVHVIGGRIARGVSTRYLDIPLGWAMMRDPRVSAFRKLFALAIGIGVVSLLIALELPLELLTMVLLPIAGEILTFVIDGVEMLVLPGLIACAILPLMQPKPKPVPVRI